MRLYRPHIPLEVKCRVALRQLGEMWPDKVIEANRPTRAIEPNAFGAMIPHQRSLGKLLPILLRRLAQLLACNVDDLRLDHDPPLGARPQERRGLGRKTYYIPDANDPEHLIYREKHAHHIKTNVRGDGAQYPDRVLIKRERKRLRKLEGNRTRKAKRSVNRPKRKWPKRKLSSANRLKQRIRLGRYT